MTLKQSSIAIVLLPITVLHVSLLIAVVGQFYTNHVSESQMRKIVHAEFQRRERNFVNTFAPGIEETMKDLELPLKRPTSAGEILEMYCETFYLIFNRTEKAVEAGGEAHP